MQTITNEQIYDRWEQVPQILREAFFSIENGEIVWKACEDAGLPEEVIDNVLIVMGNVLFGFTHVNDLAKELQSIPGMDTKAIDPIIFQIDRRVFAPVKGDILKLHGAMSGTGPRILAEEAPTSGAPAMIAGAESQVEIRKVRIGDAMEESTSTSIEIKQEATPMTASRPEPAEGPTIIHTEAELKPVAQKIRPLSSFGGMFGFRKEQPKEGATAAAQVSMVEGLGRKPEEITRTEHQPIRVVHYTSAKSPEDMFGQPAQPQKEAPLFVPVTKQEHVLDFEPKVIDLGVHPESSVTPGEEQSKGVPVPAIPEEQSPMALMPKMPEATMMKTPQRVEVVAEQAPQAKEPKLTQIPVSDDIVDLRMLERVENKK